MTVHRFFVAPELLAADRFPIPASIERQVRAVLRLADADRLVLLGGDGIEVACHLEGGACVVDERRASRGEPAHRLTVAQALLKGDALEEVVRQGTEVGVSHFRLFVSDRCVAREISDQRLERLRSIARESAEQSERGSVPGVDAPIALRDVASSDSVILDAREDGVRLRELAPPGEIVIGPEGGFTAAELEAAARAGAALAGLGPRVLRSRTVAAVAAAVVLSRAGDFA